MTAGPIKTVDEPCAHCGSAESEPLWSGTEHEYEHTTDEVFTFVRCRQCDVVRLNPRPDVSELARIYPPDYYAYNLLAEGAGREPGLLDAIKRRMYQRRLGALVKRLGKSEGTIRILDVGCADGRLLDWYKASRYGKRLETWGVEFNEEAAAEARRRGHKVVTARFEVETELEPAGFDLILASHVIEHVDDPKGFAQHAADLLAPGGLLVIYTPSWNSIDARLFKGNWGGNHFPRHWTLYDVDTLEALARQIGLTQERVEYQPNPIFWVWSFHSWLRERFPGRRFPDRMFPTIAIFHRSLRSGVLLSIFTTIDLLLRLVQRKTASIAVEMRKVGR